MKYMYKITIDDYIEIVERAKKNGKQPGESLEEEFAEYVKEKEIKSIGASELTRDEMISEMVSKGNKVLDIGVDNKGNTTYRSIKKKEE